MTRGSSGGGWLYGYNGNWGWLNGVNSRIDRIVGPDHHAVAVLRQRRVGPLQLHALQLIHATPSRQEGAPGLPGAPVVAVLVVVALLAAACGEEGRPGRGTAASHPPRPRSRRRCRPRASPSRSPPRVSPSRSPVVASGVFPWRLVQAAGKVVVVEVQAGGAPATPSPTSRPRSHPRPSSSPSGPAACRVRAAAASPPSSAPSASGCPWTSRSATARCGRAEGPARRTYDDPTAQTSRGSGCTSPSWCRRRQHAPARPSAGAPRRPAARSAAAPRPASGSRGSGAAARHPAGSAGAPAPPHRAVRPPPARAGTRAPPRPRARASNGSG